MNHTSEWIAFRDRHDDWGRVKFAELANALGRRTPRRALETWIRGHVFKFLVHGSHAVAAWIGAHYQIDTNETVIYPPRG